MNKASLLLLWFSFSMAAHAQTPAITGTNITGTGSYQNPSYQASQSIALLNEFAVTTEGFEATISNVPALAGQWAAKMNWGFVAIHTHVLPTGQVLAWQGHNAVSRPGRLLRATNSRTRKGGRRNGWRFLIALPTGPRAEQGLIDLIQKYQLIIKNLLKRFSFLSCNRKRFLRLLSVWPNEADCTSIAFFAKTF